MMKKTSEFKNIEKDLAKMLRPARYIGEEIGIPDKDFANAELRFAICYPDLYEIGMSNLGIKILYDKINALDFASCERVFSVWDDMEAYLRSHNYSLYSLETKTPIGQFDVLGISLQYELLLTNVLNIIDLSKIPVLRKDRRETDPIVLCGGPVASSPAPFSPFADLFCIGEGEDALVSMLTELRKCRNEHLSRSETLKRLGALDGFYSPDYTHKPVYRQIYSGFAADKGLVNHLIPNIEVVQNKMTIEIMRGCPNKCRFCQAGIGYKPCREKNISTIINAIDYGIERLGVKEVTLSSLSSGDYSRIEDLAEIFMNRYSKRNISFSLPSLKVETFNKELLTKMSSVRKSGLTFAIEAGSEKGHRSINKIIETDKIYEIIGYAMNNGWRLMKFYFMIGLPFLENEVDDIITFIDNIRSRFPKLEIHANFATFIPKPHTPYQYCRQMTIEESRAVYERLYAYYKKTRVQIRKHDPEVTLIEGIIARGDENVGMAIYEVFKSGVRFDGWREHFNINNYTEAFAKYGITHERYLTGKNDFWSYINVGVSEEYLNKEYEKAAKFETTDSCKLACDPECDICNAAHHSNEASKTEDLSAYMEEYVPPVRVKRDDKKNIYIMEYAKHGLMKFVGNLDMMEYFKTLFDRSGIDIIYTQGFNPHQKLQFSQALPLGVESECEIIEFSSLIDYDPAQLLDTLRRYQHPDMPLLRIRQVIKSPRLVDSVRYCVYRVTFDPKDADKVRDKADQVINGLPYSLPKKDKIVTGLYKDMLHEITVHKDCLIAKEAQIPLKPKFTDTMEGLLGDMVQSIIKIEMLLENGLPLFEI